MSQGPCEVWFYHLERTALDQALPELLEKTLAKGWKALVRTTAPERVEHLDGWLWSYRDDSFLGHGTDGEPMADRQPILLFDGRDEMATAEARGRWKTFKAAGHPVSYWRQKAERGWEQQA
jgi:DNA polymerase-3 subunit chi